MFFELILKLLKIFQNVKKAFAFQDSYLIAMYFILRFLIVSWITRVIKPDQRKNMKKTLREQLCLGSLLFIADSSCAYYTLQMTKAFAFFNCAPLSFRILTTMSYSKVLPCSFLGGLRTFACA